MASIGIDDTGWVGANPPAGWKPPAAGVDEWGCIWEKTEMQNAGQVKGHPLADISRLSKYRPPDYSDPSRYAQIAPVLDEIEAQGRYVLSGIVAVLFERMHMLHGFEDTLVDLQLGYGCRCVHGQALSLKRWIFPVAVFGSSAANSIQRGYL